MRIDPGSPGPVARPVEAVSPRSEGAVGTPPRPADPVVVEEKPASGPDDLATAVKKLNRTAEVLGSHLQFRVDTETKDVRVKVVDSGSGRVIRIIPPETVFEALAQMRETVGLLFDARA